MKTATVTWITHENFGTYLQAYALQQTIHKLGHKNEIIDDILHIKPQKIRKNIKSFVRDLYHILNGSYDWNHRYFNSFKKQFLYIREEGEVKENDYDLFIAGSDQIWSPYVKFDSYYYLGFTKKKKISYAASTGTGNANSEYVSNVMPYLNEFSHISVREKEGKALLSSFVNKHIDVVVDPTLLLSALEWDSITQPVRQKKYLFCYFLTNNSWYVNYARRYASEHGLSMIMMDSCTKNQIAYKKISDKYIHGGPIEFLSYLKNADLVLTDSFHASIFSLFFQKKFFTFKRFDDGKGTDQNARIYNLFGALNLVDRFIDKNHISQIELMNDPDWQEINDKFNPLVKESLDYLKNSIGQ